MATVVNFFILLFNCKHELFVLIFFSSVLYFSYSNILSLVLEDKLLPPLITCDFVLE